MNRPDKNNLLEICLEQLEAGRTVEEIYAEFPEQASMLSELLPIARSIIPEKGLTRVPASAQVDSRKRLLAQAQELRQQPGPSIIQRMLWALGGLLREHAGSMAFTAAAVALLFVALGSVRSLPGDQLYPVKLAAEQAGISLAGDPTTRDDRVSVFDNERAAEVAQMIKMKRTGVVSFGGFLHQNAAQAGWQIDSIPLNIPQTLDAQTQNLTGFYVEVKGTLGVEGFVQVEKLEPRLETLVGTINSLYSSEWKVGSQTVRVDVNTRISGTPRLGGLASIQAMHRENNGGLLAVSVSVSGGTVEAPTSTITPTITPTATQTIQPTNTPEPTMTLTPRVIQNIQPTTDSSGGDHQDDHSDDSAKPTEKSHSGGEEHD